MRLKHEPASKPLHIAVHTGATSAALNLAIQFWTSRGYAVADVDYSVCESGPLRAVHLSHRKGPGGLVNSQCVTTMETSCGRIGPFAILFGWGA